MNIKKAKEQIKNSITAYFSKNEFGDYIIPLEKQRPIYLVGPPGIGKTAIVEQIASEMNIGLLSYSMTHHTRQSALGLPFIEKKNYDGKEYNVSEYTMSEIIASVYDLMEETGVKEGILFLDEINCVSETLSPIMLQFLQYKIFGRHKVPAGWIVVTAGNPPEYNNSVREFDIVTLDRLKKIIIEPDYDVWKEYAYEVGIHPSITSYLEINKEEFYNVTTTVDGKMFVTARGWEDLSKIIYLYEMNNIKVDINLVGQYLQEPKISKSFSVYYDLFNKYKSDYQIDNILSGEAEEVIKNRARGAGFDERLALISLLLSSIISYTKDVMLDLESINFVRMRLTGFSSKVDNESNKSVDVISKIIDEINADIKKSTLASNITYDDIVVMKKTITKFEDTISIIEKRHSTVDVLSIIKDLYSDWIKQDQKKAEIVKEYMDNMLTFGEDVFGEGQEILIIVTEMTLNKYISRFIGRFGCDSYYKNNKQLMFYEREQEIKGLITELNI